MRRAPVLAVTQDAAALVTRPRSPRWWRRGPLGLTGAGEPALHRTSRTAGHDLALERPVPAVSPARLNHTVLFVADPTRLAAFTERAGRPRGAPGLTPRAVHANTGDPHAAHCPADLLAKRGDIDRLSALADTRDRETCWPRCLSSAGTSTPSPRADTGNRDAAAALAELLANRGGVRALRQRAETGDSRGRGLVQGAVRRASAGAGTPCQRNGCAGDIAYTDPLDGQCKGSAGAAAGPIIRDSGPQSDRHRNPGCR